MAEQELLKPLPVYSQTDREALNVVREAGINSPATISPTATADDASTLTGRLNNLEQQFRLLVETYHRGQVDTFFPPKPPVPGDGAIDVTPVGARPTSGGMPSVPGAPLTPIQKETLLQRLHDLLT